MSQEEKGSFSGFPDLSLTPRVFRSLQSSFDSFQISRSSSKSLDLFSADSSGSSSKLSFELDACQSELTFPISKTEFLPAVAEPPSPPGGYLESSHFISDASPSILFKTLVAFLEQEKISLTVQAHLFKVKCVTYPPGQTKLRFIARVFQMDDQGKQKRYAVEYQRREGDVISFSSLWQSTKDLFQSRALFDGEKRLALSTPLPPPTGDDLAVTDGQVRDTVRSLLQMTSSACYDVKSQAFAAISKMSAEDQVKKFMLEEGCMDTFVEALSSDLEDIHHFAEMTISNLKLKAT